MFNLNRFLSVAIILVGSLGALAYNVGTGIYDITGPSVEINFMGYAVPGQRGSGIHLRLKARAFAFEGDNNKRFAFVSVDGGMGSDIINMRVLEKLNAELGVGVYTIDTLSISGTHTHSGPAGFLQYVLYQITSLGYVKETFDAWVDGISQAIIMAHKNLKPGKVLLSQGDLYESNINRSPTSYLLNPQSERDMYPEGDTDKNMLLLNLISQETGESVGVVNWFAVHGTSMNNTNTLTSGDNRGYASYLLERHFNGEHGMPGTGPFVGAFASTNLGDVSPNTNGAKCIDTGEDCDGTSSTCNGRCENCIAFGPGTNGDMFESTQIIGNKQYEFAMDLMGLAAPSKSARPADQANKVKRSGAAEEVSGVIDYRHSFVKFSTLNVTLSDGTVKTLCSPAMGYSFAAGTTDGPGMFNFAQGTTTSNPFWDKVRDFLSEPTQEEMDCQAPKPILLNTGDIAKPYEWDPEIVPVQILRLGNVFILSVPGELTTMAGRRLRKAVTSVLEAGNIVEPGQKVHVTIAGLANNYASYITTYEEYQAQRYEAASTIFGPHTLDGYIQEFTRLARDMVNGVPSTVGPMPPDLEDELIQLMPEPHCDRVPQGVSFGDVVEGFDVKPQYKAGEVATATFHGANPRHNQKPTGSYLTVERVLDNGRSVAIAYDGDWETKFNWLCGKEDPLDLGFARTSNATVEWDIPTDAAAGTYKLCYFGDHKISHTSLVVPFSGCSSHFQVVV